MVFVVGCFRHVKNQEVSLSNLPWRRDQFIAPCIRSFGDVHYGFMDITVSSNHKVIVNQGTSALVSAEPRNSFDRSVHVRIYDDRTDAHIVSN